LVAGYWLLVAGCWQRHFFPATSNQSPATLPRSSFLEGDVMANFTASRPSSPKPKAEPKIIHQDFFKSVGPRTYAAQIKEIANGNHLLVLTEGKRDEKTNEVRKTRLFVYGEDFPALFNMLEQARAFVEAHPVSKAVQARRQKFWERHNQSAKSDQKPMKERLQPQTEADSDDELDR
jgi:hypothetical protein